MLKSMLGNSPLMTKVTPTDENGPSMKLHSAASGTSVASAPQAAMTVYASLNVISLFQVNTLQETFTVRLRIVMAWPVEHEKDLFGDSEEKQIMHLVMGLGDADRDWVPNWYPRYGVRNKIEQSETHENFESIFVGTASCSTEAEWSAAVHDKKVSKNDFWITRETVSNVVINMKENLGCFPFDIQELMISVRMEHDTSHLRLEGTDHLPVDVRNRVPAHLVIPDRAFTLNFNNLDTAEHECFRHLPCYIMLHNDFMNRARAHRCGALQLGIVVERHRGHYIYNVFLMLACLTTLTYVSWSFKHGQVDERYTVDFTLLLTGQAFKLVIADKLPKVNYLTAVDIYCLMCFLFMCFAVVFHCITGWHEEAVIEEEDRPDLDRVLRYIWLTTWIVANIIFFIVARRTHKRQAFLLRENAIKQGFTIPEKVTMDVKQWHSGKSFSGQKHQWK